MTAEEIRALIEWPKRLGIAQCPECGGVYVETPSSHSPTCCIARRNAALEAYAQLLAVAPSPALQVTLREFIAQKRTRYGGWTDDWAHGVNQTVDALEKLLAASAPTSTEHVHGNEHCPLPPCPPSCADLVPDKQTFDEAAPVPAATPQE